MARSRTHAIRHYVDLKAQPAFPWGKTLEAENSEFVTDDAHKRLNSARILDMRNALPSTYGYTSFFNKNQLNLPVLPELVEDVFMYEMPDGRKALIALTPFGVYVSWDGTTWDTSFANFQNGNNIASDTGADLTTNTGDTLAITTTLSQLNDTSLQGLLTAAGQPIEISQAFYTKQADTNADGFVINSVNADLLPLDARRIATVKAYAMYNRIAHVPVTLRTFGNVTLLRANIETTLGVDLNKPFYLYVARDGKTLEFWQYGQKLDAQSLSASTNIAAYIDCAQYVNTFAAGDTVKLTYLNSWGAQTATANIGGTGTAADIQQAVSSVLNAAPWVLGFGATVQNTDYVIGSANPYKGTLIAEQSPNLLDTIIIPPASNVLDTRFSLDMSNHAPALAGVDWIYVDVSEFFANYNYVGTLQFIVDGQIVSPVEWQDTAGNVHYVALPAPRKFLAFDFVSDNDSVNVDVLTTFRIYTLNTISDTIVRMDYIQNTDNKFVQVNTDFYDALYNNNNTIQALWAFQKADGSYVYLKPPQGKIFPQDMIFTQTLQSTNDINGVYTQLGFPTLALEQVASNTVDYPLYAYTDYVYPSYGSRVAISSFVDAMRVGTGWGVGNITFYVFGFGMLAASAQYQVQYYPAAGNQGIFEVNNVSFSGFPNAAFFEYQYAAENSTPWFYTTLRNQLYLYRQGIGGILSVANTFDKLELQYPTFANMQFVQGISKAKGRLLMWDSDNSVYRSSMTDPLDFEPSIATQATVQKIDALYGTIVNILPLGDGYIVYGSASVILARYVGGTMTFDYVTLEAKHGIYYPRAVVALEADVHVAYLDNGLYYVSKQGITEVDSKLSEYLASSRVPVRVQFLAGRYLAIMAAPALPTTYVEQRYQVPAGKLLLPPVEIPSVPGNFPAWDLNFDASADPYFEWLYTMSDVLPILKDGTIATNTYQITRGEPALGLTVVPRLNIRTQYIKYVMFIQQMLWASQVMLYNSTQDVSNWYDFAATSFINHSAHSVPPGYDPVLGYWITETMPPHFAVNTLSLFGNTNNDAYNTGGAWKSMSVYNVNDVINGQLPSTNAATQTTGADYFNTYAVYSGPPDYNIPAQYQKVGYDLTVQQAKNLYISPNDYPYGSNNNTAFTATIDGRKIVVNPQDLAALLAEASAVLPIQGWSVPGLLSQGSSYLGITNTFNIIPPVYTRVIFYDVLQKDWGSCDVPVRVLFDYAPVNALSNGNANYTNKLTMGYEDYARNIACVNPDGSIAVFDDAQQDSYITVGKLGLYGTGKTHMYNVEFDVIFENNSQVSLQSSLDGISVTATMYDSNNRGGAKLNTSRVGQWFLCTLAGQFKVKGLLYRGNYAGRR